MRPYLPILDLLLALAEKFSSASYPWFPPSPLPLDLHRFNFSKRGYPPFSLLSPYTYLCKMYIDKVICALCFDTFLVITWKYSATRFATSFFFFNPRLLCKNCSLSYHCISLTWNIRFNLSGTTLLITENIQGINRFADAALE